MSNITAHHYFPAHHLFLQASPEVKAIAKFLRGKDGPRIRRGLLNDKRVDYFKGKNHSSASCDQS